MRNYGALEKINNDKAENHDRMATMSKAFAAWRHAMELVSESLVIFIVITKSNITQVERKPLQKVKELKSSPPAHSTTTQPASLSKSSRSHSGLVRIWLMPLTLTTHDDNIHFTGGE